MNKILKALLASFLFAGSICSLASCNKEETPSGSNPDIPSTDIVEPHPGTDPVPDDFVPEVHEDWSKTTTTEADILMSLKGGLTAIPADSMMWVWCWGGDPGDVFVPLIDYVAYIPKGTTGAVVAFMPKGIEASWDKSLGQTSDLIVEGGKLLGVKPIDPSGTRTIEINIDYIETGLEPGDGLPGEYDLYAYPMGGISENIFVPVVDGMVEVDEFTSSMYVVFIEKGAAPAWGNALAQTVKLSVGANGITVPEQIKPGDLVEYTVDEASLSKYIKGGVVPEMSDLYAFTWSNDVDGGFYRVQAGSFKAPKTALNVIFVYMIQDQAAGWDNALAQTCDMIIENGQVIMELNKEFSIDMTKVGNSLEPGVELPLEYELFVWAFYSPDSGKFSKVTDSKFVADRRVNGAVLVFMPKGSTEGDWSTKLCKSIDLEIKDGAVVLPDQPAKIEMLEYQIDRELIACNLKDGKTAPAEYDLYVFAWTSGVLDGFHLVEGNTYLMDSRVQEFLFALVKKGEPADWGTTVLAQTVDLKTKNGEILYPNAKPADPIYEDYTINSEAAAWNILASKPEAPKDGYELYVYYWGKGFNPIFVKVVDNKVSLDNRLDGALCVFVKAGETPSWEGTSVITQTTDLVITGNNLAFQITENPNKPAPEVPNPDGGAEVLTTPERGTEVTTTPEVEVPSEA